LRLNKTSYFDIGKLLAKVMGSMNREWLK